MMWIFRARDRAQKNAPAPEAENEYSKGPGASRAPGGRAQRPSRRAPGRDVALAAGALIGAVVLIAAEFTTLYTVHVSTYGAHPHTVSAGSHHSYALVPIGLLAALLGLGVARRGSRPALLAIAALGVIALVISLVRDLPDTHAHGITNGLAFAGTTTGLGMYLETLGAVILLATGGSGLLAAARLSRRPARPGAGTVPTR